MSDMKTPKSPPWKFSVWRKDEQLAEFDIPAHKLESHEVGRFLHALVVRSRTNSLEEMIKYYVNNRRGHPTRVPFAEVIRYSSDEFRVPFGELPLRLQSDTGFSLRLAR